jgi:glycosyltransferase involved in cell wall biosynthesis
MAATKNTTNLEFPKYLCGKKVLLATESFGPINGVSKTTLNLVKYLRDNGVDVAVVAPEIGSGPKASESNDREVRLQGYPLPYNPELSVVYPVRLSQLYARTFGTRPDLIYLASPASLGFQILFQLRQQQKSSIVPVLLNFQTDLSGYCEILFPTPLDHWAVWVFRSVQGYLFRHESVKTVFYPSQFVRKYLEKAKVQQPKLTNLRRGVNGELFHPSKRSEEIRKELAPNGEIILTCVSRLGPEKGFGFLAAVAKRLKSLNFPFKLRIVGGNPNSTVVDEIKDHFDDLCEDGTVSFTGFLKGEELATAYASADLFLHCSITETFGLVVLESMASGVPVIARDEGGPSDIVANGKSGFLVPPHDLDEFVERVLQLSNEPLRARMSVDARKMAEEATWEKINNTVAWKMARTLKENTQEEAPPNPELNFSIPIYSWLLLSPGLREMVTSMVVGVRLMGCIWMILGVWAGLILTWVSAQAVLLVKPKSGRKSWFSSWW